MPNSNKSTYRQLCEEKPIPLFMQAWWMDAACGADNWDVLLFERNGLVQGVLTYLLVKKFVFRCVLQPQLTQYNGVWINYPEKLELEERLTLEKVIMTDLIEQIEKKRIHYFNQNFHYSITNWQPFFWKGFSQTTRYTYLIEDISNPDNVYTNFSYAKQKHIKKSEGKLLIDFNLNEDEFYAFHVKCLKQKGENILYSKALFSALYSASLQRNKGMVISARDERGNIHAALFVVWNRESAYNLISAIDIDNKSSGASTLVVWEAIKFLSDKTNIFDFEGSMIEGVAQSFQQFGTIQQSYFNISKSYSSIINLLMHLRNIKWK